MVLVGISGLPDNEHCTVYIFLLKLKYDPDDIMKVLYHVKVEIVEFSYSVTKMIRVATLTIIRSFTKQIQHEYFNDFKRC